MDPLVRRPPGIMLADGPLSVGTLGRCLERRAGAPRFMTAGKVLLRSLVEVAMLLGGLRSVRFC